MVPGAPLRGWSCNHFETDLEELRRVDRPPARGGQVPVASLDHRAPHEAVAAGLATLDGEVSVLCIDGRPRDHRQLRPGAGAGPLQGGRRQRGVVAAHVAPHRRQRVVRGHRCSDLGTEQRSCCCRCSGERRAAGAERSRSSCSERSLRTARWTARGERFRAMHWRRRRGRQIQRGSCSEPPHRRLGRRPSAGRRRVRHLARLPGVPEPRPGLAGGRGRGPAAKIGGSSPESRRQWWTTLELWRQICDEHCSRRPIQRARGRPRSPPAPRLPRAACRWGGRDGREAARAQRWCSVRAHGPNQGGGTWSHSASPRF
mmetsp:Transcript_44477/g.141580  ORF Transcript_44477/g.141580 Transcript_44477/m.141580 type:complete len:315 (-) Transcript_44477:7-951(-)